MKSISIALALLLVCACVAPTQAQSKKKSPKAKAAKPTPPDTRTVAANPIIEGDPITKPDPQDNRIVSASPVIEGDPMIPEDRISIHDLKAKLDERSSVLILDVRSADGWKTATTKIKSARRVVIEDVEKQMKSWPKSQEIIAYCACSDDATSLNVTQMLKKAGFKNVKALWGGWNAWQEAGYPTEPK
jgi:rhodanese-related sulfurtransferase